MILLENWNLIEKLILKNEGFYINIYHNDNLLSNNIENFLIMTRIDFKLEIKYYI